MPGRFPGESEEYRRARDELLAAEMDLRWQEEAVAARRRALPLGGAVPTDYEFDAWDDRAGTSRRVRLSELFDDGKDTLFLYSFMWVPEAQGLPFVGPCPSCTLIIDGIDGAVPHFTQLISFAVAVKTPIDEFRAHGERRGWRHARLLSAMPSRYSVDYEAEDENGYQWPLATVFTRRDGTIHHMWSSELWSAERDGAGQGPRHVDFMWPLWGVLDRTPPAAATSRRRCRTERSSVRRPMAAGGWDRAAARAPGRCGSECSVRYGWGAHFARLFVGAGRRSRARTLARARVAA